MVPLLTGYALVMVLFLGLPWSHRTNPAFTTDRMRTRRTSIGLGMVHLLALSLPLFVSLAARPSGSVVAWAAVAAMIAALGLQRWSQRALGRSFTLALQAAPHQAVCRSGPYRWIRHPGYLAQIVFFTAFALTSGSWAAATIVGVAAVCAYAYRIANEEEMLRRVLDDRYRDYAASTRRLIPFLY
jgi:protein-S-isoprenylcysteine O-methyltransferase